MKAKNFVPTTTNDVFQVVTDRIIKMLEDGVNPWRKTWLVEPNSDFAGPKNYVSKKPYRGINFFMLSCTGFSSPYFLTMKQVNEKGGQVIKGEKATPVVFAKTYTFRETKEVDGESKEVDKKGFCYKLYYVFNIEQTTLEVPAVAIPAGVEHKSEKIEACESILRGYQSAPTFKHGGSKAYYRKDCDLVQMPAMSSFNCSEAYYSILFHEIIHSTGHPKRLNREGVAEFDRFGSKRYSQEELIAEMGAAYLNSVSGISSPELDSNSASYIKGWLKPLKNDKKFVFKAASAAQKATAHILGEQSNDE
ncbi:hypothetical protein GCM10007423_63500 [Dyadobacter endophyticus]|uniref:Antirestriction protein ArdC n=1 Tax=Dyadobacter endophyticus TaxID=1749036 RepID=A0ABQ1ZBV5_9BACT|nr:zincin-like metallopeptidase domain-containing protein [Dyadobacter endophyticus]GGH55695.1 hypothetical protein GCM10007423_63500 [Dyadobacter endophyticus]